MASSLALPRTRAHPQQLTPTQLFDQMISHPDYEATVRQEPPRSRLESTYVLSKEHKPIIASNFEVRRGIERTQRPVTRVTKLNQKVKQAWRKWRDGFRDFRKDYVKVMECMYGYGLDRDLASNGVYMHRA